MNRKLVTTALFIGATTLPVLGFSADTATTSKSTHPSTATNSTTTTTDSTSTAGHSAKEAIKDSVITTKIKAEMVKDPVVSAMHIKVDTDNQGVVSLSGTAKSKAEADKAVAIAHNTKGVTSVKNNITVAAQ
jgi:hyperosmotically inducible protein